MTLQAGDALATPSARRALSAEVSDLIRRREFEAAERTLVGHLTEHPGPIATACRGVPADGVRIDGWEEVVSGLAGAAHLGVGITAVGLDLSNFSDGDGADWADKEPVVEVSWYDDTAFPFSAAARRDLLDASEEHPLPWSGAGATADPAQLVVTGLRALNGALLRAETEKPWTFGAEAEAHVAEVATATLLGGWFLHLRFHEAVARHLVRHGPEVDLPVVVGQHGVGPFLVSAYLPSEQVEVTTGRLVAERTGTRALLELARRSRRRRDIA